MKSKTGLTLTITLTVVLTLLLGCLPSVHPLFTDKDLAFREDLLGSWKGPSLGFAPHSKDSSKYRERWHFEKESDNSYNLIHVSEQDTAYFEAFLVRLGDHYFLDLVIEDIEVDNTLALYHLFPVHTFSKVSFEEDRVNIEMFNSNWIIEMIENEKVRIKHEKAADMVLLTASTSELQKFILKYVEEPKAYSEPIVLTRDRSI